MEMRPVESSNIDSVGYDRESRELRVRFKNGGLYSYEGVPEETHQELIEADSVGEYLHQNVKGTYPHTQVDEE